MEGAGRGRISGSSGLEVVVRPQDRTVEEIVGNLASRSHGVVARADLSKAGVTPAEVKSRLNAGSLIRVHRGVFRVGHQAPSIEARYMAAVKAVARGRCWPVEPPRITWVSWGSPLHCPRFMPPETVESGA
jgi:hypothetical protein